MIKKLCLNSTLLLILIVLISAPVGTMGLMSYKENENPQVLSSQDQMGEPSVRKVPSEVEEIIKRMEEEVYQTSQSFSQETEE